MKALVQEKQKAIALRKAGYSYQEILLQVPVAKSSLSLWLKDLPLTPAEKKVLKKRTDSNISVGRIRAAASNHKHKLAREREYLTEAQFEFQQYAPDSLFHTGLALYWAEGAKRNELFQFMNSDDKMIEIMLLWLERYTHYSRADCGYRLYTHQPFVRDNWEEWWGKRLSVSKEQFKKTVIKPSSLKVKKRPNYRGCLRVEVPRSVKLLTKTKFWINMSVDYQSKR